MNFHFLNIRFTTDRFIALIIALIIIFLLFNELVKLLQKGVKSKKASNALTRVLFMVFLGVACFFLLKYTFGW